VNSADRDSNLQLEIARRHVAAGLSIPAETAQFLTAIASLALDEGEIGWSLLEGVRDGLMVTRLRDGHAEMSMTGKGKAHVENLLEREELPNTKDGIERFLRRSAEEEAHPDAPR
jgi:hypothetical protein